MITVHAEAQNEISIFSSVGKVVIGSASHPRKMLIFCEETHWSCFSRNMTPQPCEITGAWASKLPEEREKQFRHEEFLQCDPEPEWCIPLPDPPLCIQGLQTLCASVSTFTKT